MTKRPKKDRETAEFAAFAHRIMRSLSARAGDDPEALTLLAQVAADADLALSAAVARCHDGGYSNAEIAARLGVSRQAVHQRITRYRAGQTVQSASTA
jgi:DNA-binding NarL/FixJ family response regulator